MSRALGDYMTFDAPSGERQVAYQVQNLVTHVFITEPQGSILRPSRPKDDRVFFTCAANQPHVPKLLLIGLVAEGACRRDKRSVSFCRKVDARRLTPDGGREIDRVLDSVT